MTTREDAEDQKKGIKWFWDLIGQSGKNFNQRAYQPTKDPFIGGLFAFSYDPKHKETLPLYDTFPLVMPFNILDDGFMGINWHYMKPPIRRKVLSYLMVYKEKKSTREYVRISYNLIQSSLHSKEFEPAIKRYLTSHIRSRLIKVDSSEWKHVAALPLAQWKKGKPF